MFTGIIQHCGVIASVDGSESGVRMRVELGDWGFRPALGDSIAVNGCCLTVANEPNDSDQYVDFDVIHQTLRMTGLGSLAAGDRANMEHAVTPATLMSGHVVQGHVDGVGRIVAIDETGGEHRIRVEVPADLMPFMVSKGSVAIDGVSLTIADLGPTWVEVALIPTTLEHTNLDARRPGDGVNLEADYFAKILVGWLERRESGAAE